MKNRVMMHKVLGVGGTSATLSNLNRAAKPSASASEGVWYPGEVGARAAVSQCSV